MPKGVYVRTEAHRLARLGRRHSVTTCEKIKIAHVGIKMPAFTDLHRAHMRDARKLITAETRARISNARRGMKFSETHRRNMGLARVKYPGATHRDRSLRRSYGITETEYHAMLTIQNDVCAICGGINSDGRRLAVDHDHNTKKVRGLLCTRCNRGLGAFNDSAECMKKASEYLTKNGG